ncbi:hypothetical protein ACHAPU_010838 [Fusarium lateritium]
MTSIQSLPLELLLMINEHLCPDGCPACANPQSKTICHTACSSHADLACLALTCQWGYWINGGLLRSSKYLQKLVFLSHLEERGLWPSEILCHVCEKFHTPRKGLQVAYDEGHRSCVRDLKCEMESFSDHLPRHIHFDLVAAVARSHRLRVEPPLYPPSLLSSTERVFGENCELCCLTEHSAHFSSQGNVILKTQKVVSLASAPGKTLHEQTLFLKDYMSSNPSVGEVCSHAQWSEVYPSIFANGLPCSLNDNQWSFPAPNHNGPSPSSALYKCFWTHKGDCSRYCRAQEGLCHSLEGRIWCCDACTTDYAINNFSSKSSAYATNFLVLTSWKDLGKGESRVKREWYDHLDKYNCLSQGRFTLGEVAREVEDLTVCDEDGISKSRVGSETTRYMPPTYYYPAISKEKIERAFDLPKKGSSW